MHSKATRAETCIGITGHLLFSCLVILALWFWQERTLILDAAFQSYLFIATGRPAIMVERFGAAMVQLLPLAGVWAAAPLKTVLMLYSVSIVLFHWGLFSICLHGLRDKKAAFAILLFNVLLVGDSFYWMQNELLQAISLMFVMWSLWMPRNRKPLPRREIGLGILLAVTVIYYHPLVFFPLAFVWIFFWLRPKPMTAPPPTSVTSGNNDAMPNNDAISQKNLLAVAALFALIFSSKYIFRQPNFYDRGMTGQYVREFNLSPVRFLQSQSLHDFLAHLNDNFILLLPLLILVTGFYIWKKRYRMAALAPVATAGYCLLVMQRFLHDDRWYIQESHYQALAVFLIVPLVWDVLPGLAMPNGLFRKIPSTTKRSDDSKSSDRAVPRRLLLLAGCLLLFRITGIWNTHHAYTTRLAYVRGFVEKSKSAGKRKLVIAESQADRKTLMMYWGLPFEIFQISALESPDSVRAIAVSENPDSLTGRLSCDSMVTFLMIPPIAFGDLPPVYYRMQDTSCWKNIQTK